MRWGSRLLFLAGSLAVAIFLVWLWQLAADHRLVNPVFLPGPDRAWKALMTGFSQGDLGAKLLATIERMFWGWLIASLAGAGLGAIIGSSPTLRAYLAPTLEFLRPLPASATIPVAIAIFGLSDGMVLVVIAFGAMWPVLLATIHGFSAVEPRLYEVMRALGFSRAKVIWKVALPSASPDILAGMRLGLTVALILSIVCEMIAGRNGLGNWILLSARSFRAPDLYAGVILLGALGYATSAAISVFEQRLLVWRSRAR
ncbi:ABC transporter permease [Rhizobium sp. NPDC090279]|uniref:ABC transporter permease n=1 Tax=Rhizobium sp. NPDC090279 TaxID=3364499 RepID=UPI00383B8517